LLQKNNSTARARVGENSEFESGYGDCLWVTGNWGTDELHRKRPDCL